MHPVRSISRKHNLLWLFVLSFYSINAQNVNQLTELRIDPSNSSPAKASAVLEEINYIPLETTKESLFGAISQLFVTDRYFIILDGISGSILIFEKNGKFHCCIKRDAYNNKPILYNTGKKIINYYTGRKLVAFDLDGKKLPDSPLKAIGEPYFLYGNISVFSDYRVNAQYLKDTISHELSIFRADKKIGEYLPYNMKTNPVEGFDWLSFPHQSSFYETGTDTSALYCRHYDYNVYQVTANAVIKKFTFILPQDITFPESVLDGKSVTRGNIYKYFNDWPEKVSGIIFPYQVNDCLFFKLNTSVATSLDSYLYNLKSGTLISLKDIVPDSRSNYLPVTDFGIGENFVNNNFLTSDGVYVYSYISSATLFNLKENSSGQKTTYSESMTKYFTKGNRKDNPVLIQLKPRSQF